MDQFKNLIDQSPTMIWAAGQDSIRNYFNLAWLKFSGKTLEEELRNGWMKSIHEEDHERVLQLIEQAFQKKKSFEVKYRRMSEDKAFHWVLEKGAPLFSERQELLGYTGSCIDVGDLEKANAHLNILFENMTEGMTLQDTQGRIILVNKPAQEIFGLNAEEVVGSTPDIALQSTIRENGEKILLNDFPSARALQSGNPQRDEILGMKRFNQETRWLSVNANPVFFEGEKKPSQVVVTFRDITEKLKVQHALKQVTSELALAKDRMEIAMRAVKFGIWDWDLERNILIWDDYMYELFGIQKANFSGAYDAFEKTLVPEEAQRVSQHLDETAKRGAEHYSTDFKILRNDGAERIIGAEAKCFYNSQGKLARLVGANWDITDSRKKDEAIKKALAELDQFFSISLELMGIAGMDGYFKRINPKFTEVLGYGASELLDKPFTYFIHPDDLEATALQTETLTRGSPVINFENRYRTKSGKYRILSWTVAPSVKDQLLYFAARDVTEMRDQQLALIQKSKMSSLGEMSAGIAHEINNPLAIIKGRNQQIKQALSKDQPDLPLIKEFSENIDFTVDRITKIIKGLRAFSRESENDLFEIVPLRSIVDETLSLCSKRFESHGVNLKIAEIPISLTLECRPFQISQVLLNVLNNAFDAVQTLDERWVELDFFEHNEHIEIMITDSGKGIPEAIRQKILQPFFTTKAVGMGTGLGLSISSGIIKSHHGHFRVDKLSLHTRFCIILPKRQPKKE